MQELILDNGIKEIAVKKENGDLITVLKINVADGRTAEDGAAAEAGRASAARDHLALRDQLDGCRGRT